MNKQKKLDLYFGFQGEDKDQSQIILNNAFDVYENLYNNPTNFSNPSESINKIANTIQLLKQQGNTIQQIAANPTFELSSSAIPPVVPDNTANESLKIPRDDDNVLNE